MTAAYPLQWPDAIPRAAKREAGSFRTELNPALKNVEDSLRLFGVDSGRPVTEVVLSSNVTLGNQKPADPGVAAWFKWDGEQRCIPVDRYDTVKANLQAIHHVLEARRVELRHGTLALVRATFEGFKMLPPPPGARPWRDVLGLRGAAPSREEIEAAYRRLSTSCHPDKGGTRELWDELQRAKTLALRDLSGG